MKKSKLTLEKFQIAKLVNPFKIFGGTGESAVCDTNTNPLTTTNNDTTCSPTDDPENTSNTQDTVTNEDKTTSREGVSTVPTCPM